MATSENILTKTDPQPHRPHLVERALRLRILGARQRPVLELHRIMEEADTMVVEQQDHTLRVAYLLSE